MSRRRAFSPGAVGQLAETGRELWLAGLGALSEGLVERGKRLEREQLQAVDRAVTRGAESAERLSDGLRRSIQTSVEEVLHRVDLPSRDDLKKLSARLDRLAERIEGIAARRP